MSTITAAGLSDPGCKRARNEDRILIDTGSNVFVLADGMGGERCGELAAELAVRAVAEYLQQPQNEAKDFWPFGYDHSLAHAHNRALNAVRLANRSIWETCKARPDCDGMGSTLSAVFVDGDLAAIGNIGDSRVYLHRNAQLQRLTRDDAIISNLIESGQITVEQAKTHPLRNVLTSSLGRSKEIKVQLTQSGLRSGDRLLLSTDGLHGVVEDSDIERIIENRHEPQSAAQALVEAARKQGGPDNISCIVIACL